MAANVVAARGLGHVNPSTFVTMETSPTGGMRLKEIGLFNLSASVMNVTVRIHTFTYTRVQLDPGEGAALRCGAFVVVGRILDVADDVGGQQLHWHLSYVADPNAGAPPTLVGDLGYYDGPNTAHGIWVPTVGQHARVCEVALFNASTTTPYLVRVQAAGYYLHQYTLDPLESIMLDDQDWYLNSNTALQVFSDAPDGTLIWHYTGIQDLNAA